MPFDLQAVQNDLRAAKLDGWLFYDFRGRDPIAHRILMLPASMRTRRWFYFVPAKGAARKLVHKIESESLAALPGDTLYYASQDELRKSVGKLLGRAKKVAMQYSPKNEIPYVSIVDAGTIELVRGSYNPGLALEGVVLTMFDARNNLARQVMKDVQKNLRGQVYETVIPRNVRLSEAPSHGRPAILYDIESKGAQSYLQLAEELVQRHRSAAVQLKHA